MATASFFEEELNKEVHCGICSNLLREPKDLNCNHTYCLDCLKPRVQKESTSTTIECPECHFITIVPQEGLPELKTNCFLKIMAENRIKYGGNVTSVEIVSKLLDPKTFELQWNGIDGLSKLSIQDGDARIVTLSKKKPEQNSCNNNPGVAANEIGSSNKELKLTFLAQIPVFFDAYGVAANQSDFFAVAHRSLDIISTYGKYESGYKKQCQIKMHKGSRAVAISSQGKLLISDDGVVKVYSSAGTYERSWPRPVDAHRITITPDDMVVIGSKSGNIITVHQCDGQLIRTHQIETERQSLFGIASNGKQIAFTAGNNVRAIDFMTGQKLWTLTKSRPSGICYDQSSNTLLVSRCPGPVQGIIEQHCSTTGRVIASLVRGLFFTHAMTITKDKKLVVVDGKTVRIFGINN